MSDSRSGGVQTLVVGADAACLPVLDRLFDGGDAPTALTTPGLSRDELVDGRPLAFVDAVGTRPYPEYRPRERERPVDDSVTERLQAVGYLDGTP